MLRPHPTDPARSESPLLADLRRRLGTDDLFEWIETQAEQLAALDPTADRGPVTLPPQLLRARNIRALVHDPGVRRGRIVPARGGFEIRLNPALPAHAKRFAIAHELGHTFWFASANDTAPLSPCQWSGARDPEIEMLCDRFAAALLLPRRRLLRWLKAYGATDPAPRFELLAPAARAFDVATQAVARRLYVDLRPSPLAIVCTRRIARTALFEGEPPAVHWETSWCAVPEFVRDAALGREQTIPLKSRRRIPEEMHPQPTGNRTCEVELDARWLHGVTPGPKADTRRPLSAWPALPLVQGHAWRAGDRAVIGIPV